MKTTRRQGDRHEETHRDLPAAEPVDGTPPYHPSTPQMIFLDAQNLRHMRHLVAIAARRHGLDDSRAEDLVLSVNELLSNSLRHGGGSGSLRMWTDDRIFICEIEDAGHFNKPLAGERPSTDRENGFGLWLVNQLCDLVQVRTVEQGTVIRLHMARA